MFSLDSHLRLVWPASEQRDPLAWGPPVLSGVIRFVIDKVVRRLFPIPASKCDAVASLVRRRWTFSLIQVQHG